ncbi:MAG: hypothetical protein WBO09_01730 [Methylocystis silviterrae]|uniref:hypothetical protein n=1 Tax=Methylocystis silviterrae TaxID=2743612 RepID=UPI003C7550A6
MKKFRIGSFEGWIVGPMKWEVRHAGRVVATAGNMNECAQKAQRLYDAEKAGENLQRGKRT